MPSPSVRATRFMDSCCRETKDDRGFEAAVDTEPHAAEAARAEPPRLSLVFIYFGLSVDI